MSKLGPTRVCQSLTSFYILHDDPTYKLVFKSRSVQFILEARLHPHAKHFRENCSVNKSLWFSHNRVDCWCAKPNPSPNTNICSRLSSTENNSFRGACSPKKTCLPIHKFPDVQKGRTCGCHTLFFQFQRRENRNNFVSHNLFIEKTTTNINKWVLFGVPQGYVLGSVKNIVAFF